jgi:hypothetical protein
VGRDRIRHSDPGAGNPQGQSETGLEPTLLARQTSAAEAGNCVPQHGNEDPCRPWKYIQAFAGGDIEANPPATNDAVQQSGLTFDRQVHQLPPQEVLAEIDEKVDFEQLERFLMDEGIVKFSDPQRTLLEAIAERRAVVAV